MNNFQNYYFEKCEDLKKIFLSVKDWKTEDLLFPVGA